MHCTAAQTYTHLYACKGKIWALFWWRIFPSSHTLIIHNISGGVTPIPSVLHTDCNCDQWTRQFQSEGQWSNVCFAKRLDGQSYMNKAVHKNIAKINRIRSKVNIKFWRKSTIKAENPSWPMVADLEVTPLDIWEGTQFTYIRWYIQAMIN